ncbi:MAG TPA: HAD hydrolase-like protein, partial [Marinagarivorans sp.]
MKKLALPQLVIYDLDGTLIDSVPDIARAMNCALQELYGTQAPLATVSHWVGNGSLKLVSRALAFAQQSPPHAQQHLNDDTALEKL